MKKSQLRQIIREEIEKLNNQDQDDSNKILSYIKNGSKGNLDLRGTSITSLPDNLLVNGGLDISNTAIKSLPNNLTVNGSLDFETTAIKSLPKDIKVKGGVYLKNTPLSTLYHEREIKKISPGIEGEIFGITYYY